MAVVRIRGSVRRGSIVRREEDTYLELEVLSFRRSELADDNTLDAYWSSGCTSRNDGDMSLGTSSETRDDRVSALLLPLRMPSS